MLKEVNKWGGQQDDSCNYIPGYWLARNKSPFWQQELMKFSEVGVQRRRYRGTDGWVSRPSLSLYVEIYFSHCNGQALTRSQCDDHLNRIKQRGRSWYLTERGRKTSPELESASKVIQGLTRLLCGTLQLQEGIYCPATTLAEGRPILFMAFLMSTLRNP